MKNSTRWSNIILIAGLLCLLVIAGSVFAVRVEWLDFRSASSYVRYAVQAGLVIVALAILLMVFARTNRAAIIKGLLTLVLVLSPLLIIKANMPAGSEIFAAGPPPPAATNNADAPARRSPPLNDISTDTQDPPRYNAVIALRAEGSNSLEYAGEASAKTQQLLFPDIKSIHSTLAASAAFNRAINIAEQMGWEIIAQDQDAGTIEAVASTPFFNFKDDVVIRVRTNDGRSVIDIRSHSRVGRGDRGKNAQRVREFIKRFSRSQ